MHVSVNGIAEIVSMGIVSVYVYSYRPEIKKKKFITENQQPSMRAHVNERMRICA